MNVSLSHGDMVIHLDPWSTGDQSLYKLGDIQGTVSVESLYRLIAPEP